MGACKDRRRAVATGVGVCVLAVLRGTGCGPGALLAMSLMGGAAAVSGEPQRLCGTQGQDFEQRASMIRSGVHTPADVARILGNPQTKLFTNTGEEWSYRYYVPATSLRSGQEKILTVRFRGGKVDDVRYTVSALKAGIDRPFRVSPAQGRAPIQGLSYGRNSSSPCTIAGDTTYVPVQPSRSRKSGVSDEPLVTT
jgi:hypothetical protein